MPVDALTPGELQALAGLVERWTERWRQEYDLLLDVQHDAAERRWYVRLRGEEKQVITVWLTLRERTLHFETYFMPAPEENAEQLYEWLLRVNAKLYAMRFAVGLEDAVYLVGQLPVTAIDEDELDRVVGSAYAYSEQYFRPAMRIGYASKFRG